MMLRTKTAAQLLLLGSSAGGPNFSLVGAVDTAKEQNRESMLNKQKEGCTPEAKNEAKTAPAAAAGPYADLTCEEYDKLPVLAKVSVQCDSGAAFYRDASKIAKPGRVEEVKKACCKIAEGPGGGASFLQTAKKGPEDDNKKDGGDGKGCCGGGKDDDKKTGAASFLLTAKKGSGEDEENKKGEDGKGCCGAAAGDEKKNGGKTGAASFLLTAKKGSGEDEENKKDGGCCGEKADGGKTGAPKARASSSSTSFVQV